MADNYLEKKMEDYLRSRGAGGHRGRTRMSPGTVTVRYPSVRVLVADGCSERGRAIIAALRSMGCRVAFVDADSVAGNHLAQDTGSQFHPGATVGQVADRFSLAGDPVVAVISPDDDGHLLTFPDGKSISLPAGCTAPDEIASFCVYALHPSAAWLRR